MSKESNKKEKIVDRNERKEGSDSVLYFLLFLITRCMRLYEAVRATGAGFLACFTTFACNHRQGKAVETKGAFSSRGALSARGDDDGFSGSEAAKEGKLFCDGSSVCKKSDAFIALVKREARELLNEIGSIANRAVEKIEHAMFGGMNPSPNTFVFATATQEGGGIYGCDGGGIYGRTGGGIYG